MALCIAIAMILSYVETLIPPLVAIPGVKMGLPNIVIVFVLYRLGVRDAAAVSLVRVLLVSVLFGNIMSLWYSIAGAALSLAAMLLIKHFKTFSITGVSVIGAVMHNAGQIIVAVLVTETVQIGYYMPVLIITGTLAGIVIGVAGAVMVKRLDKVKI